MKNIFVLITFFLIVNNSISQENCPTARLKYLEENPDVKKVNIDPWAHFINYGKKEGRVWPSCQEIISVSKVSKENDIKYGTLNTGGFLVNEKGFVGGLRALSGMDQVDRKYDDTLKFNLEKLISLQKTKDSIMLLLKPYENKSFTYFSDKLNLNRAWSGINDDVFRTYNILKSSDLYLVPDSYYHDLSWLASTILDGKKYHKDWKKYDGNNRVVVIGFNSQEKYFFKPLNNQNIFGMENEIRIHYAFLPGERSLSKEYEWREFERDRPQCLKCSGPGVFYIPQNYSIDYLNYRNKFFSKTPKVDCETCRMMSEEEKNALIKQITNLDPKYFDLKEEYNNVVTEFSNLEKSFVWKINSDFYYVGHLDKIQKPYGYGKLIGPDNKIIFSGMWENGFPKQIGEYFLYSNFEFPNLILMSADNKNVLQIFSGTEINTNSKLINLYLGEFSSSNRNGFGQGFHTKCKYIGNWKNGLIEGKGEMSFYNGGDTYKGNVSNGKFQGFGEYYYSESKKTFKGNWVDNKANGYGELYSNNGTLLEKGNYINGEFQQPVEIPQVNQIANNTDKLEMVNCSFQFSKPKLNITWVDNRKSCCNPYCKNYATYSNNKTTNQIIAEKKYLSDIMEAHFLEVNASEEHKKSDRLRLFNFMNSTYINNNSNDIFSAFNLENMGFSMMSLENPFASLQSKETRIKELKSKNREVDMYSTGRYCSEKCKKFCNDMGY